MIASKDALPHCADRPTDHIDPGDGTQTECTERSRARTWRPLRFWMQRGNRAAVRAVGTRVSLITDHHLALPPGRDATTLLRAIPRSRWFAGLLLGVVLFAAAVFIAHAFPSIFLGRELEGTTFAIVALLFAPLAFGAVAAGLRVAGCRLADAGFSLRYLRADVGIGAAVAVAWALLQFLLLIPLTGGAERADVVINAEQIGPHRSGLAAFVLLAWCGGFAEEVFFRSLLMTSLRGVLGGSGTATALVVLTPTTLFAAMHGYQGGWVGILDTGIFGGLTLSLLFLWRGRLTACVVAHGLWNTIASIVIFVRY